MHYSIKNDTNLVQREVAYYQSLLDSASSKETPVKPSALGKSVVSKNGVTNSKLRNISKLLFGNPAQAVTLFLAAQVALANAGSINLHSNKSAIGNSTLLENDFLSVEEERVHASVKDNKALLGLTKGLGQAAAEKPLKGTSKSVDHVNKNLVRVTRQSFGDPSDTISNEEVNRQLAELLEKVKALESDVRLMREYKNQDNNTKASFSTAESKIKRLQEDVDNVARSYNQRIQEKQNLINNLEGRFSEAKKKFESLKSDILNRITKLETERKCLNYIAAENFTEAAGKLVLLGNDNEDILGIVDKAYQSSANNFPGILKFGDAVADGNPDRGFIVYKTLFREAKSHSDEEGRLKESNSNYYPSSSHYNPINMINLLKSLKSKVIQINGLPSYVKKEAESLVTEIESIVKTAPVKELAQLITDDKYPAKPITNAVYNYDYKLFKDLIKNVVNHLYSRNLKPIEEIKDSMSKHATYTEDLAGYIVLFEVMQKNPDKFFSYSRTFTDIEFGLLYAMKDAVIYTKSEGAKADFESLKSNLPSGTRDIVFSPEVCIIHKKEGKFLYDEGGYGGWRKEVGLKSDYSSDSKWTIEYDGGAFWIRNCLYNRYGRYLYIASWWHEFAVYTWNSDKSEIQQDGKWRFKRNGDAFLMKSEYYNRCLSYGTHCSSGAYPICRHDDLRGERDCSEWIISADCSRRSKRDTREELGKISIQPSSNFTGPNIEALNNFIRNDSFDNEKPIEDKPSSYIKEISVERLNNTEIGKNSSFVRK